MPYQFIGRTTSFKGKPLWEILGNLKDFGVGRLVIRHRFQRYLEPCFLKILKVAALPNPSPEPFKLNFYNDFTVRKCIVLVEETFRGKTYHEPLQIDHTTYKSDYQLIPKDEEYKYLNWNKQREEVILPRTMEFPPLLREIIKKNMKATGQSITGDPQLKLHYNETGHKVSRIAKEGEKPTVTLTMGLGKPANPGLYANCKPI